MGLDEVLRALPAAVVIVEAASGRVIYTNERSRRMTERQLGRAVPEELTDDWEIFHPDGRLYRFEEWPLVRSIRSGERVMDEECFNVLPDGGRMSVRCSSSPIRDDAGRIVAGVLVMEEVTEQKRVEDELRHHASLVENLEDAVVETDAQYRVTAWNRGAERLYGFTAQEALGRPAREIASYPGDRSRHELEAELRKAGRSRSELTAHRKDGTPVEVELITVAVRGDRGEVTGYLGIHRDVTERNQAQQRLVDALEGERRRIARDLHDEALSHLTLATIDGLRSQSASREPETRERLERLLQSLKQAGEALRGVIYDLRLSGEEERPFVELLEALVASHRRMAVDADILVQIEGSALSHSLGTVGTEILRVTSEALTNARRHSRAATIRVKAVAGDDRTACVEVIDDGVGFDLAGRPPGTESAGIAGMRERAALLKADLDIRTAPRQGTTVRLQVALV